MREFRSPMKIDLKNGKSNYIFYKESTILMKLTVYPYIQLTVIVIFIIISYLAFSFSRRAEQNKVWLGLSRETAHQLGTPTSSLLAWVELLKETNKDSSLISELEKDVLRLNIITERFSKIGSIPKLEPMDLYSVLKESVEYMKNRVPVSISLYIAVPEKPIIVSINNHLFGWVLENLIKNAIDAVVDKGLIDIKISTHQKIVNIDIFDNGKGISKGNFKRIFRPGFTTKLRGWGLGLSLTKRIIEEYHHGKIFVLHSELNRGTTFRITLPFDQSHS
jgi:signal transduction histidine kinase